MWLLNSSIGKKLIMSISGLFLIVFLTVHMVMNLVAVFSLEGYDAVCEFMGTNPIIQLMVPVLAAGFIVHIIYAGMLTLQNQKARGNDKYATSSKTQVNWASKNMFVLGIIVLGVLCFHLTHFWAKMQLLEWQGEESMLGSDLVVTVFKNPVVVAIYLVWIWALWFHLTHGFWSALQTLGTNNKKWYGRLKCIGIIYATILALGFSIVAVYFFFGPFGACCAA
ncbi:MAG: succinate dehydrogenase cytochrome b subunit [Porphyromonadaceae bacterium]|nr:succinate dehydrogenase cytochrome b subunit [uncultured Macellibacteroides sp.]MCE5224444.1 succinate dehydrogenase cytochrome b subunit [Porphyromonadaceae bacterium]